MGRGDMGQFSDRLEAVWPNTVTVLAPVFTTRDFVEALKARAPNEWAAIVARYGPGGRGAGNFFSPANIAFNFLKRKASETAIFRRQFVPATADWGSPVVAQWELATPTSSLPLEEGDLDVLEGRPVLRQHFLRERAIGLRPRVLRQREKVGLVCDCCSRSEPRLDITLQRAMFEVHHKVPLAAGARRTTLADVNLLCATCHRLIHRAIATKGENVTAEELQKLLRLGRR